MASSDVNPQDIAREGYNKSAQRYLDWTLAHPSPREKQVGKLIDLIPDSSSASVLELGCGAGVPVTEYLSQHCRKVVANDISSAQIGLAKERLRECSNVEFMEGDMLGLDFDNHGFDAVAAIYSIIHLDPAGQKTMFERIRRWLKSDGGLMLVNVATTADRGHAIEGWLGMKQAYWSSYGLDGSLKIIQESGFEVVSCDVSRDVDDAEFGWVIAKAAERSSV